MQLIILTLLLLLPSLGMRKQVLEGSSRRSIPLKGNVQSLNNYLVICGILFLCTSIYCIIVAILDKNVLYFVLPFLCWFINYRILVYTVMGKVKIKKNVVYPNYNNSRLQKKINKDI